MKITVSEAFVEALRRENVEYIADIVGSAFMDPLDLFPEAGIRFIQVRHEQSAAFLAEGYVRATEKPGVCIGQNGPGVTNLVTGIASAQLNHSPVIALTPAVLSSAINTKAFQEVDQMRMLDPLVVWQMQVDRPSVVEIHVDSGVLNEPYRRDALKHPVRVTEKYQQFSSDLA